MAETKRIVRSKNRRKGGLTKTTLATWFKQWTGADREAKAATARKNELRDRMLEAIEREGYEDDKGHVYLDLPEEIDGYSKIQRQRRVSQGLDHEATEELLKAKNLWKDCTRVVRVIDEEEVAKAVFDGRLTKEEWDSLIQTKETFAFVPVR